MTDDKQAHDDISYVRSVLERAEDGAGNPAAIYFLWAAITFFGFAIIDFAPEKTGLYWLVAAPLGGILSAVLGHRAGRTTGQPSAREGRIMAMHWGGVLIAMVLIVPLALTHIIDPGDFPRLVLLVIALSYYTAGVHVDRRLIPVSIALAASLAIAGRTAVTRARRAA